MKTKKKSTALLSQKPLVSIIITTYNRRKMLLECVANALAQRYENFEVIVSDNASSDETETSIRELTRRYSRLKYFRHDRNIGADGNFIHAIKNLGDGDWVVMVSDDDLLTNRAFLKSAMTHVLRQEDQGSEMAFYQSGVKVQDEIKNQTSEAIPPLADIETIFHPGEYMKDYPSLRFFSFTTTCFNRRLLLQIMPRLSAATWLDVNLMLVLSLHGAVILSRNVDGVYRIHGSQNYAHGKISRLVNLYKIYPPIALYATRIGMRKYENILWLRRMHGYFYEVIIGTIFRGLESKLPSAFERILFWHARALKYQLQIKIGFILTYLITLQYLFKIIISGNKKFISIQIRGNQ